MLSFIMFHLSLFPPGSSEQTGPARGGRAGPVWSAIHAKFVPPAANLDGITCVMVAGVPNLGWPPAIHGSQDHPSRPWTADEPITGFLEFLPFLRTDCHHLCLFIAAPTLSHGAAFVKFYLRSSIRLLSVIGSIPQITQYDQGCPGRLLLSMREAKCLAFLNESKPNSRLSPCASVPMSRNGS